ncbi:DUF3387 domain-containing protein [Cytophagia bacterium CHB2]|nr:DUF3387 domain-containing protein [Cytophagia bacterium CHB2]
MSLTSPDYFDVVRAVIDLLTEAFGYQYAHGASATFNAERASARDVLLAPRLLAALQSLNPQLRENEAAHALSELLAPQTPSPLSREQHIHHKLIRPAPAVDQTQPRYFAFDDPGQNDFLIVEQLRVQGLAGTEVFDLVVFVNGIPLVVFEVGELGGAEKSVARLQALQRAPGFPRLFDFAQFFAVLQKNDAVYGALGAVGKKLHHWREPFPLSFEELRARLQHLSARPNDLPTSSDLLVAGLLAPANLLEMIRHFIFFEHDAGAVQKKIAFHHQFQAAQQALQRLLPLDVKMPERAGFIWHPLGAGRALALCALALKLRRAQQMPEATLLIITECEKVQRQIEQTFQHHGLPLPLTATNALTKIVHDKNGATIITNAKTLQDEIGALAQSASKQADSAAPPLLVLLDETYRDEGLHEQIHRALSHAGLIVFMSTLPKPAGEQLQRDYIHVFTYRQAQQEGLLVPAKYEPRLPDWHVWKDQPAPAHEHAEEQLHPDDLRAAKAEDRLAAIAQDVFEHYEENVAANGYKAILLAVDDEAALRYYGELVAKLPQRVAVLTDSPRNEEIARAFFKQTPVPENVIHRSHFDNGAFAIFITSKPIPLSSAAPNLQTIYLDQPASERQLLQLINLTMRVSGEHKTCGLLVDYWGVTRNLPLALPALNAAELRAVLAPRFDESSFAELQRARLAVLGFFDMHLSRWSTEPWLLALQRSDTRQAFARAWRAFGRLLDQLLPHAEARKMLDDAKWLDAVRQEAASFYLDENLSRAHVSPKVHQAMASFIAEVPGLSIKEYVSVYAESFDQEVNNLASPLAQIARVQHALLHETAVNLARDPAFYEGLQQRTHQIMRERQHGLSDDQATLKKLWVEIVCLRAGPAAQANALGLSEEAFAFFGVLQKFLAPGAAEQAQHREQHRAMANAMLAAIAPELAIVDWNMKESVQREMRRKLKQILREARCPKPTLEPLTAALLRLIHARFGKLAVYR